MVQEGLPRHVFAVLVGGLQKDAHPLLKRGAWMATSSYL